MKFNVFVIFLFFGLCSTVYADVEKCPAEDLKCVEKVTNEIFSNSLNGLKELNLGILDPFPVSDVQVKTNENSPINLNIKFSNMKLYGFTGATASNVKGFKKDLSGTFSMVLKSKVNYLVGNYEMNGKFLVLPITGKGACNITLVEPTFTASFKAEPYLKDGNTYLKIKDFRLKMDVTKVINNYENLLNDKILSDSMNALLNENWKEFHNEASGPVVKSIGNDIRKVISKVFETKPYAEFFA